MTGDSVLRPGEEAPAAAVANLIARARDGPVPVIALTDEEIAALDSGPDGKPVAPQPWLAGQEDSSKKLICQVALRGLAARGIVVPVGAGRAGSTVVAIHQDLRAAPVMRRSAMAIVLAQRQTAADINARLLYLHDDGGVLEEDVSPGGVHDLTVTTAGAAAERMAVLAGPDGVAGEASTGPPCTVSLTEIAAVTGIPGVDGARWVTAIGRLGPDADGALDEERFTVYAQNGKVVLAEPVRDEDDQPALALTEVNSRQLRARLAGLLRVAWET